MDNVCVCIFRKEDKRTVEQRLKAAVLYYLRECGQAQVDFLETECGVGKREESTAFLRVKRTAKGKPYFPDCPKIQFSISHSGDFWVCAVSGKALGIGLQKYTTAQNETRENTAVRLQKMAGRFFHSTEVKFVEFDSYWNFFAVWAAKEAYVKYTGQGIDRRFSQYCVIPGEESWQKVFAEWKSEQLAAGTDKEQPARLSEMPAALCWQVMEVHFWEAIYPEGYALCVCTESMSDCRVIVCDDN